MRRQYITFEVGGQFFGLDIMAIREIRAWTPVTRLPRVPHYLAGVVNLRGTVVPIVDLAARFGWAPQEAASRFGWAPQEAASRHVIIVTHYGGKVRGMIVESVSDIVWIDTDTIQPPPDIADDGMAAFIEGLATVEERMVMVLDLRALNARDRALAEAA